MLRHARRHRGLLRAHRGVAEHKRPFWEEHAVETLPAQSPGRPVWPELPQARRAVFSQLAELLLPRHLEGLPHSSDQRHLVHRPRVYQDRQSQKHGRHQPAGAATSNPACFIQRIQVFANGQRCDDINYYGRTVAAHDLLKGREYNQNKAVEGFDKVNNSRTPHAVHQSGYADVLLRPTMVGILRCGKMLPPQLNLVIEIKFADATTALWSGPRTPGRTRREPR